MPHAHLIVRSQQPFNAEPPLDRLRAAFVTPEPDFYVRSHGAVPEIDPDAFLLEVGGRVARPAALSLPRLRDRHEPAEVTAYLQCAGNRRGELQPVAPTTGDPWGPGAIGNARWSGVRLGDVLRQAGLDDGADLHVALRGHDSAEHGGAVHPFEVSIPLAKALSPEVVLADRMNGEPLTPAHGAPLRLVVPGFAGIRSVKWLAAITVREGPSDNPMQARDYKLFPPHVARDSVDWSRGHTIDEMPLTSAICEPAAGAEVPAGRVVVRGYAAASGRAVARVDLSTDGGRTWREAGLERDEAAPWAWTLWSAALDLPAGDHELVVRAWDSAGQTQPSRPEDVWNFKGYLCASWHRVAVRAG